MLRLAEELHQLVQRADGSALGRLRDLTVRLGDTHPTVHRLLVGKRPTYALPWSAVRTFEHSAVELRHPGALDRYVVPDSGGVPRLENDELLLVRDVLDTQIVDVVGHRLARVSDVLLARLPDGRLEVAAVDIGPAALARRLGLGVLQSWLPERAIDWADLHLTSRRGHQVQLATPASAVHRLDPRALAELLTRLSVSDAGQLIHTLGPRRSGPALARVHPEVRTRLARAVPSEDASHLIDELPDQPAADVRRALEDRPPATGRRYRRLHGWRRRRPPQAG